MIEMSAPPCRVFARAKAAYSRPIQNAFDAPADAGRRLRLRGPDWLQRLEHERRIDHLHRHGAENGTRVGGERCQPLRRVLAATPSRAVGGGVLLGCCIEGHAFDFVEPRLHTSGTPMLDWIDSLIPQPSRVERLLARRLKVKEVERAKAHLAHMPLVDSIAINPRGPALGDLRVQAAAIG